ncbi:MAG: OmpA family protein [Candidatus Binatia bacterium]
MSWSAPRRRPFVSGIFYAFCVAGAALVPSALQAETPAEAGLEERRLELDRRELELKKEELKLEQRRLEIATARKKLLDQASARDVITIQLQGEVLFDFGKGRIRPGSEPTLEKIAAVIQQFPGGQVVIAGHTDSIGGEEANVELSKTRAGAVREWLVTKGGLDKSGIAVEGYGESQPIAPNQTADGGDNAAGRQRNRRVEIKVSEIEKRSPEVEAALKELGARETDESLSINLAGDVLFPFGKATILPDAERTLQKVATVLEQFPDGSVRIQGYTDATGPEEANLALSEQRAAAVKRWLVEKAEITPDSIMTKGFGEADPVAPNAKADGSDNPAGRQQNRRVEIVVTKS